MMRSESGISVVRVTGVGEGVGEGFFLVVVGGVLLLRGGLGGGEETLEGVGEVEEAGSPLLSARRACADSSSWLVWSFFLGLGGGTRLDLRPRRFFLGGASGGGVDTGGGSLPSSGCELELPMEGIWEDGFKSAVWSGG